MQARAQTFLKQLLDSPGPSGYEAAPSQVWRAEAATFADEVHWDVLGNSYARLRHDGGPVVVIEGHIDEIGFQITHIDSDGFLWFRPIGGWDAQIVTGQRVRIATEQGDVFGVVGRKAAHLLQPEDREKAVKIDDLWIDIGAKSRPDALKHVQIGDAAVVDARFIQLTDDLCVSRSLDNRVGAFVALEALRILAGRRTSCDVYALAATQEEITFAGAYTGAFALKPALAIALDVTHATDYPGGDKKRNDEVTLGGGPVLLRGAASHPAVYAGLREAGQLAGIPLQVQASPADSYTDADAMIRTGAGTATSVISIPNRYMHSPNEVVSLQDLENCAKLIAEYVLTIDANTDFRR